MSNVIISRVSLTRLKNSWDLKNNTARNNVKSLQLHEYDLVLFPDKRRSLSLGDAFIFYNISWPLLSKFM